MYNMSENYYLRKCYLQRDQVPTQSVIRKKMTPALADVYFKSMTPKLKRLAGLEPSLKGGGNDWYVPPEELLKGRAVLKPVKKSVLMKLNHQGVEFIGDIIYKKHRKELEMEKAKTVLENDETWREFVTNTYNEEWDRLAKLERNMNSRLLVNDFESFTTLYRRSFTRIETLFHETAIADLNKVKADTQQEMQNIYKEKLKYQANCITDAYEKKLMEEKARLKAKFIEDVEICRTHLGHQIHDIHLDKQTATETLKHYLKQLTLACQVYVALKERDECLKERKKTEYQHRKLTTTLTDKIALQNFEIDYQKQRESALQEHISNWKKKLYLMMKKFQLFVSYSLNTVPENADFFINLEKLMLLQLNKALEQPSNVNIFEAEEEDDTFKIPVAQPKTFYLFCDKGYKANVDHDLCPKHSGTSSPTVLPAVIVNKRILYAACDNFDQFTSRIREYINGRGGDDTIVQDDLVYENFVPVRYTPSQQLNELKLESSIMQIVQQEIHDLQKLYSTKKSESCHFCKMPTCSCTSIRTASAVSKATKQNTPTRRPDQVKSIEPLNKKVTPMDKDYELSHEREPKWENFLSYIDSKKCVCLKKKYVTNPLPPYMTKMKYGPPLVPDYKICPLVTLKELVKKARKEAPTKVVTELASTKKCAGTQCDDEEYNSLCACFADDLDGTKNTDKNDIWNLETKTDLSQFAEISGPLSKESGLFAEARAHSLRSLLEELPHLQSLTFTTE
ncbi:uncharacterized protein LOC118266505 [Spodoptera frugiperda]|uniref:Uncharacterized protein LOC118266505 n=1 Tax=Spodoptera frugiperda TaxID=7108 RepID=A0A9R0D056_SPOFR|nr:uncharacterized protein LOC118266505 [Spodoptera frugiperda]